MIKDVEKLGENIPSKPEVTDSCLFRRRFRATAAGERVVPFEEIICGGLTVFNAIMLLGDNLTSAYKFPHRTVRVSGVHHLGSFRGW